MGLKSDIHRIEREERMFGATMREIGLYPDEEPRHIGFACRHSLRREAKSNGERERKEWICERAGKRGKTGETKRKTEE